MAPLETADILATHGTVAQAFQPGRLDKSPSSRATAQAEIGPESTFDCGDISGKVFDDGNRNGYQDEGEIGIAGARVTSMDGFQVTTDHNGRFYIACEDLPGRIGRNYILKLDPRSLPSGYRILSENPRTLRLTTGEMTEISFATSLTRVVRLDLTTDAFIPGSAGLAPEWELSLLSLIATLEDELSVLRVVYRDTIGDPRIGHHRLKELRTLIEELWRERPDRYPLEIETALIDSGIDGLLLAEPEIYLIVQ